MDYKIAVFAALAAAVRAQQACDLTAETHPSLTWSQCSAGGTCTTVNGQITIDANWRWTHAVDSSTNCYTGNTWDTSICDSDTTCATACCVDGSDYEGTYGITSDGDALTLAFVTGSNVGSRTYLMASETEYEIFDLLGNEFTFDVDVSNLPCGLNGALYFVSMDADGGTAKYPTNTAGAKYGTGYCDSQCPRDLKFIDGEANIDGWVPSSNDANTGLGNHGSCCAEMDIWEANSVSSAVTPHPCLNSSQHMCDGNDCGGTYSTNRYAGDCDPDGCDFNSYRMGNTTFYGDGSGFTVDTSKVFTVVTQFLTNSSGGLSEIKRFYVQDNVVIPNSNSDIAGVTGNSITSTFCDAQKTAFGDENVFDMRGGMSQIGEALGAGMVLVMSLWDDYYADMLWLDSTYPTNDTSPGGPRGTCSTSSGVPAQVESEYPSSNVIYSNIKFGPINSTFSSGGGSPPPPSSSVSSTSPATSTSSAPGGTSTGTAQHWGQCGGIGWTGPTTCAAGYTCTYSNPYYSQCL